MKRISILVCSVAALATASLADGFLRVRNGAEERASVPADLPASVTNAYVAQLRASGYLPLVEDERPWLSEADAWCCIVGRTLEATNGVWHVGWEVQPVPVSLDRAELCSTILALPDGTNLLAAAMSDPAVADWFVADPVYVRGSELALAMQQLLGLDQAALENLLHPSGTPVAEPSQPAGGEEFSTSD